MTAATPARGGSRPGLLDRFLGPGHTAGDLTAQLVAAAVGAALVAWYLATDPVGPPSTVLQTVVLALLVLDLMGGVVSNSSAATKAWYHRDAHQARHGRVIFVAAHVGHLAVIAFVLLDGDWVWLVGSAAVLAAGTAAIELAPRAQARVVAAGCYVAAVLLTLILFPLPESLAWVPAVFFLKLFVAFLVPDTQPTAPARS